jgi:hypothetical protein
MSLFVVEIVENSYIFFKAITPDPKKMSTCRTGGGW